MNTQYVDLFVCLFVTFFVLDCFVSEIKSNFQKRYEIRSIRLALSYLPYFIQDFTSYVLDGFWSGVRLAALIVFLFWLTQNFFIRLWGAIMGA